MQKEVLAELAKGQEPYATILGCSDSRVPPKLVFDAGFGELFVIRVAGNVLGPSIHHGAVAKTEIAGGPNLFSASRRHNHVRIAMTTSRQRARHCLAAGLAAAGLLSTSGSYGQAAQAPAADNPVPAYREQTPAPVRPDGLTCNELKAQLKAAGQMSILSGPKGAWGDTFYGPEVPRCQFYQMPQFTYVRTRDGLCGVGYICIDKLSFD